MSTVLKWPRVFRDDANTEDGDYMNPAPVKMSITILDIEHDVMAAHNHLVDMQAELAKAERSYESHVKRLAEYQANQPYGHEVAKIIPECRRSDDFDE